MINRMVVAGTREEYTNWVRKHNLHPGEWWYVSGVDMTRGFSNPKGIFIGTWYKRKDIMGILIQLKVASHEPNPELDKIMNRYAEYKRNPVN
jgi:hypothetical protein